MKHFAYCPITIKLELVRARIRAEWDTMDADRTQIKNVLKMRTSAPAKQNLHVSKATIKTGMRATNVQPQECLQTSPEQLRWTRPQMVHEKPPPQNTLFVLAHTMTKREQFKFHLAVIWMLLSQLKIPKMGDFYFSITTIAAQ